MHNKKEIAIILSGGALFAAALLFAPEDSPLYFLFFLAPYLVLGLKILKKAFMGIIRGRLLDESFLMGIATIGAFAIAQYPEAVGVMLFYRVGEYFQDYAVNKSRRSIAALMDINPEYANLKTPEGLVRILPEEAAVGDIIAVKSGEKIPLDGTVVSGTCSLDTRAITGEAMPADAAPGSAVFSGCVNLDGYIEIRVEKEFSDSTVSKILELVENSVAKKARQENFITKFSRVYTPAVVGVALLLALIPPLIQGFSFEIFRPWLYRALIFLVISCPCALVLSVPLSFFGGIGGAARLGILFKGGNYLDALARADIVAFDKTGTLSKGVFKVTDIVAAAPEDLGPDALLYLAASAESRSGHPIAAAILGAAPGHEEPAEFSERPGRGVYAMVGGKRVLAGSAGLIEEHGISFTAPSEAGTIVHVAADEKYAGYLVIADELKDDSAAAIRGLRAQGIKKIYMLTGDNEAAAKRTAGELGLDGIYAGLLPGDKVGIIDSLIAGNRRGGGSVIFAGDGINDAPVIARADVGVAMGGLGSDAAIEAADAVIMTDEPSKLVLAVAIAKKTRRIVTQNIAFALGVKAVVLLLGALDIAVMWEAVLADVGVSVIAILNAMRAQNLDRVNLI